MVWLRGEHREILRKPRWQVHPVMQDADDADVVICEYSEKHVVPLISAKEDIVT